MFLTATLKQAGQWCYPSGLVALFVVVAVALPPVMLLNSVLFVFLAVILVSAVVQLLQRPEMTPDPARFRLDLVVISIVAIALTGLYWYQARLGMTGWNLIGFDIATTLIWWIPATAFAARYRHPGESWRRQGWRRFSGARRWLHLSACSVLCRHDRPRGGRALRVAGPDARIVAHLVLLIAAL